MIITPKHRPTLDREIGFLNTHDTTLLKETPIGNNDQSRNNQNSLICYTPPSLD